MRVLLRLVVVLSCVSCGGRAPPPGEYDARDVSGNYALTYDDQVTLRLNLAGGVREVTQSGYGGIADFGTLNGQPLTLDVAAFCARPEVQCPSEAFWSKVAITQPDLPASGIKLQKLLVINDTVHVLDAGVRAQALGGLVDNAQADRFVLGLGFDSASSANCLALSISLAGGRFNRVGETVETTMEFRTPAGKACTPSDGGVDAGAASDAGTADGGVGDAGVPVPCTLTAVKRRVVPPKAAVAGIDEGTVALGFAGGCAFGPIVAGAAFSIETGFTGKRTGDFEAPPYTPAEVVVPDGGLDALDAGP